MVVLDPFGENGRHPRRNYNPLWDVDPDSVEAIDQAGAMADALIVHRGRSDPHWTDAARAVMRAMILLVLTRKRRRNLMTLRQLLMLTHPTGESRA